MFELSFVVGKSIVDEVRPGHRIAERKELLFSTYDEAVTAAREAASTGAHTFFITDKDTGQEWPEAQFMR